jgi:hypothetical protein
MAKRIQKRLTSFFSKINLTKLDEPSVENISPASSQSTQSFHLELTSSQLSPPSSQESQSSLETSLPSIKTNILRPRPQSSITITKINKNVNLPQQQTNSPKPPSQSNRPQPPSQSNASQQRPIVCDEHDPATSTQCYVPGMLPIRPSISKYEEGPNGSF